MTTKPNQTENQKIRLNKLLARFGLCSRRKADEWIREGRVSVGGIVCREVGVQVDPIQTQVAVDGKPLKNAPPHYYIVLNKPAGYVTTRRDPQRRKTVLDLLPQKFIDAGVFPVGRLDFDSEGLLLLTNDGDWAQILLHPRHQIWKEYIVQIDKPLSSKEKSQLEQGVPLDGQSTLPAIISPPFSALQGGRRFVLAIREGRNRQIRRMCAAIGLKVLSLKRQKMGPIRLKKLEIGKWRLLQDSEVNAVFEIEREIKSPDSTT
ncbi:MAG: rRNA pseudouridine synthase [Candidatus Omnitrophica bacterium]|nr:rRNA pseudouridine synthase [Candidatus Omnitrophota bacterium]